MFRIALVNAFLTLITLGIYRFWAKTRIRQYLWNAVSFEGDRLEYTGTGKQLFLGFLIALLFILPLFAASVAVDLYVADLFWNTAFYICYTLAIFFLINVARFRVRRYRLGHTVWRGIRGGQAGSSLNYAARAFGYQLLATLSAGLLYPLMRLRVQEYLLPNTQFGSERFAFSAALKPLFRAWLWVWVPLVLLVVAIVLGFVRDVQLGPSSPGSSYFGWTTISVLLFLFATSAFVWYRVTEFRYFASCTRYGNLAFESELKVGRIIKIYGIYAALLLLSFVAVGALLSVFATPSLGGSVFGLLGLSGLVIVLVFVAVVPAVLGTVFLTHPLARAIASSLGIMGSEDFDRIFQNQQSAMGRGEGLAEVFDLGDF